MPHRLSLIVFVFLSLALATALKASETIATATFGPGPTVNYVETVGPVAFNSSGNPVPPSITEGSSPCITLFTSGCSLGSFSDAFPNIIVPAGDYIKSASLTLTYLFSLGGTPLTLSSVTPINPAMPYTAGYQGSHAEEFSFAVNSAAGSIDEPNAPPNSQQTQVFDYTAAVISADSNGIISLAPITATNSLFYSYSTGFSALGGINSNTLFTESFDVSNATIVADLTVVFAPEASASGMLAVGLGTLLIALACERRRRTGFHVRGKLEE